MDQETVTIGLRMWRSSARFMVVCEGFSQPPLSCFFSCKQFLILVLVFYSYFIDFMLLFIHLWPSGHLYWLTRGIVCFSFFRDQFTFIFLVLSSVFFNYVVGVIIFSFCSLLRTHLTTSLVLDRCPKNDQSSLQTVSFFFWLQFILFVCT